MALHGAVRGTIDIDIIINIEKKSFKKAERILKSLGLTSKIPVKATDLFKNRIDFMQNKNLVAWSFYDADNPLKLVDIIIVEDLRDYQVEKIRVNQHTIAVLTKEDLIKLKEKGERRQDREDVRALKRLMKIEKISSN